jgi:hypothetical protein
MILLWQQKLTRCMILRNGSHLLYIKNPGELCRVFFIIYGVAFDVKKTALNGLVWNIRAEELLTALRYLQKFLEIQRVSMVGDYLRAITTNDASSESLENYLKRYGNKILGLEMVGATLKDVFWALSQ